MSDSNQCRTLQSENVQDDKKICCNLVAAALDTVKQAVFRNMFVNPEVMEESLWMIVDGSDQCNLRGAFWRLTEQEFGDLR